MVIFFKKSIIKKQKSVNIDAFLFLYNMFLSIPFLRSASPRPIQILITDVLLLLEIHLSELIAEADSEGAIR